MAKPKNVTIKLTAKQRTELKRLTGTEHSEVRFEPVSEPRGTVAGKNAPRGTVFGKNAPRGTVLGKSAPRGTVLGKNTPRSIV